MHSGCLTWNYYFKIQILPDFTTLLSALGVTRCLNGKESACWCRRHGFDPWVRKTPLIEGMATHSSILAWRIPWTEESGSPWGCKELDMTERACTHTHTHTQLSLSRTLLRLLYYDSWGSIIVIQSLRLMSKMLTIQDRPRGKMCAKLRTINSWFLL